MHLAVALLAALILASLAYVCARGRLSRRSGPPLTATQIRRELLFLRDAWLQTDSSFGIEQRNNVRAILTEATASADSLTPDQFALTVSRAVALSRNGHTAVLDLGPHFHTIPLMLYWFADGLHVVRTAPRYRKLLGAQIERLGALPVSELIGRVSPFISGTDHRIRAMAGEYLRLAELLKHIGASTSASQIEITARLCSGENESFRVPAEHDSPLHARGFWSEPWRSLTATPRGLNGRWLEVLDAVRDVPCAYAPTVELSAHWVTPTGLYLRSNRITSQFLPLSIGVIQNQIVAKRPCTIIVDLRFNNGGDFTYSLILAQALPKLISAQDRLLVLVGPGTFSGALVTAALLKQHGGPAVTLLGEPMGDANPFWSEGSLTRLPFSRMTIMAASRMHDWERGCTDRSRCYWANAVFGGAVASLQPAITVPLTFADYAAGRDRALEIALSLQSDSAAHGDCQA